MLLVGIDDFCRFLQVRNFADHLIPQLAMGAHDGPFFRGQFGGLAQDGIRNRHFADIVQKRSSSYGA